MAASSFSLGRNRVLEPDEGKLSRPVLRGLEASNGLRLLGRKQGQSAHEKKQMTTVQAVGAVSSEAQEWYAMDWPTIERNVRRLQVRIAQATKEGRWGKVRALQRLLTHSYSGKALAVRRVTENNGKKTPGVDQEIWDTPEKKTQAVRALKS